MGFSADRNQLRGHLLPDEDILATDVVVVIGESPRMGFVSPTLVATDRAIYVAEGPNVRVFEYDDLEAVGRKKGQPKVVPGELRLVDREASTLTVAYERRAKAQPTADVITERFFGKVVSDTAEAGVGPLTA